MGQNEQYSEELGHEEHMCGKHVIVYSNHKRCFIQLCSLSLAFQADRCPFSALFGPLCRYFPFKEVLMLLIPCVKMNTKY